MGDYGIDEHLPKYIHPNTKDQTINIDKLLAVDKNQVMKNGLRSKSVLDV